MRVSLAEGCARIGVLVAVCVAGVGVAVGQATAPALAMGSVNVGSSTTGTVTFSFSGATAVSSISVLTQGATGLDFQLDTSNAGTCAATTYSFGQTCSVGVKFSPGAVGTRLGAVVLATASGAQAGGVAYVSGVGTGGVLSLGTGTQTTVTGTSTFSGIFELTTDSAGNLYVGDFSSGTVYKEAMSGSVATETVIATGISSPGALSVDGAGNVYVAAPGNADKKIWLFSYNSSNNSYTKSALFSCATNCFGVTVDGAGDVYYADGSVVYLETLSGGLYTQTQLASGLNNVTSIGIDPSSNIYLADAGGAIYKLAAGTYTKSTVVSGLSNPNGLVVDAAGNIYFDTTTSDAVFRYIPTGANTYSSSIFASTTSAPNGIAFSPQGVLYYSAGSSTIYAVNMKAATDTTSANVGSASTEQTYSVLNIGNAISTFAAVSAAAPAILGPSTNCTASGTIATDASCVLGVKFSPTAHGPTPQTGSATATVSGSSDLVTVSGTVPGDPHQLAFTTFPTTLVGGGSAGTIAVTEQDASGVTALYYTSAPITLTVTGTDGSSTVFGPVNATNSVATFNTSSLTLSAGVTYTFTATSPGLTSASSSLNVMTGVGSGSGTLSATLTITTAGTPANINVLTQGFANLDYAYVGGTCSTSTTYTVGQTCTVTYSFTPHGAGVRLGGISLTDSSNKVLASAFVGGVGSAPIAVAYPGTQSNAINVVSQTPFQIVVDVQGNLYLGNYTANTVTKYTLSSGSYTPTVIASGMNTVAGIGVDGLGNVFVADGQNNRILKETWNATAGTYTQSVAFNLPANAWGVAVDSSGNLYLSTPTVVYKETLNPTTGAYTQSIVDNASGFSLVTSIAVDQFGNLYLSDSSQNKLFKETYSNGTYTRSTIDSGFNNCAQLAVDASGAVYTVSNGSNGGFRYAPLGNGTYSKMQIGFAISSPNGIAVDSAGNLYISENSSGNYYIVKLDVADPLTLTFGTTAVGSSSAPQQITLVNEGNAALTLGSGTNPVIGADFTLGASSTCPSGGGTLGSGLSCNEYVSFAPATSGVLTESLVYTDNNLNASNATQSFPLVGGQAGTLSVTSTHSPSTFYTTATGTYTLTVSNNSSSATSGTIVLTDLLPVGMTATAISGTNWTCNITSLTCTQTTSIAANSSASPITLTVSVAANAVSGTNYVNVSGGGSSGPGYAADATTVVLLQSSIVVNNTGDPASGTAANCATGNVNTCTLRDAITLATAQGGTSTTSFSSLFNTAQTITLTSALPAFSSSSANLTLTGPGQSLLTISGNSLYRPFSVASGTTVNMSALTMTVGFSSISGGCISNGGTLNLTNVTVSSCSVSNSSNAASSGGGGIFNSGTLTLTNSSVTNNTVNTNSTGGTILPGGGITNLAGTLTLTGSSVIGNTVTANSNSVTAAGGGIYNSGTATLTNTLVLANQANNQGGSVSVANGGGIYNTSTTLHMSGSTIGSNTDCSAAPACGNIATGQGTGNGGGLYNTATVTLDGTGAANAVSYNTALTNGGGINTTGTLTLNFMTISGNNATTGGGGGILSSVVGTLTLTSSTVSGNTAKTAGGGIDLSGTRTTLTLTGSTVSSNTVSSGTGGGIASSQTSGTPTITGSTISGNSATGNGGGMLFPGILTMTNTTVANNSTTATGATGIGGLATTSTTAAVTFNNVTISGNANGSGASDFSGGKLATGGNNLFGTCVANCPTGSTNFTSTTYLSALGNYGGTVQTILPLPGSVAIGGGSTCTTATDARGYTRATSGVCDAGAVQTGYAATWSTQPPSSTAVATNFTAAVTLKEQGIALNFAGVQTIALPVTLTGTGTLTGSPLTSLSTAGVASGTFQVSAAGTGDTLTALGTASNSFNIGGSLTTPTVAVSTASASYGTATKTLSATVTYTGGTAPTGTFSFQVDSGATVTASCSGSSSPLTCTASYTVSALTAGSHTITGSLAADANFNTASGTNTLTIAQAASAAIVWSPNATKGYAPNAIGAGVLNATDTTPGTIAYTATLLPSGSPVAVTAATVLANGSYTLTANFTPTDTADYTTTSATVSFTQQNMNVFLTGTGKVGSLYNSGAQSSAATSGGGIGAAVDSGGFVWSIDSGGVSVSKFTDAGAFSADYSSIGLSGATSLAMDGVSKVWVTNSNGTLTVLSNTGAKLFTVTDTSFSGPTGVAVDSSGNVWVSNGTGSSVSEVLGGGVPAAPLATAMTNSTPGSKP